jgi:hypothetical protein
MTKGKTLSTSTLEKYRGQWIVVDRDWKRVIASSVDPRECAAHARAAGKTEQVYVYRVPEAGDLPPAEPARAAAPSPALPTA